MKKTFLITIDTESDNQWSENSKLTTQNAKYLPRFQFLCEKYGFKPVYLTDYSMASDRYFIEFAKEALKKRKCEIGMHPHPWDTPPFFTYDEHKDAKPYLIEYPEEIMYAKLVNLTNLLETNFEEKILSHRAGRWTTNAKYLKMLGELGYKIDCSVTPGINWSKHRGKFSGGTDYSKYPPNSYVIQKQFGILEVPVSVRKLFFLPVKFFGNYRNFMKEISHSIIGKNIWLRPSLSTEVEISHLLDKLEKENSNYIEFMMHSSEFMPGGSPYFKNQNDIEILYKYLDILFRKISLQYEGKTLVEYYKETNY